MSIPDTRSDGADRLKKKIQEIQENKKELSKILPTIERQINALQYNLKAITVVCGEVNALPSNDNLYHALGNMYVKQSRESLTSDLGAKIEACRDMIGKLERERTEAKKRIERCEEDAREIVNQIKRATI